MQFSLLALQHLYIDIGPRGPFHKWFFHRNSNSMENWFQCNSIVGLLVKFWSCHESTAVVLCAKLHSHMTSLQHGWDQNEIFIEFWLQCEKLFIKWAPGDAYMLQSTRSSLVQVFVCFLIGAKPLPKKKLLTNCQLDPKEQTLVKFELMNKILSWKYIWELHLKNVVPVSISEPINS